MLLHFPSYVYLSYELSDTTKRIQLESLLQEILTKMFEKDPKLSNYITWELIGAGFNINCSIRGKNKILLPHLKQYIL